VPNERWVGANDVPPLNQFTLGILKFVLIIENHSFDFIFGRILALLYYISARIAR
jgi:hypothetical protein